MKGKCIVNVDRVGGAIGREMIVEPCRTIDR
jgi:hypothetical protein